MVEQKQLAAKKVEDEVLEFLIQFSPAQEMKIGDIKLIAANARSIAFEAFRDVS